MKKPFSLLDAANVKLIRAAFSSGKKRITLGGRTFLLSRQVVKANYETVTTPSINQDEKISKRVKRKENWIVVKPERGDLPCANIELKPLGNLRASVNGK